MEKKTIRWEPWQEQVLLDNPTATAKEIAAAIGIPPIRVDQKRRRMHIKKEYDGRPMGRYLVYRVTDRSTGELVVQGLIDDVSKALGMSKKYVHKKIWEQLNGRPSKKYNFEYVPTEVVINGRR